ncbi:MAG TPA: hypothetical protein VMU94_04730 [Streptosporangiaceae bacterium]|nr:hypothetical protein [Streptosporangiaceae bacterium]
MTAGTVRAVVALNRGRTTVTVQTSLSDEAGRLVAQTTQPTQPTLVTRRSECR